MASGRIALESFGGLQTIHAWQAQVHQDQSGHGFASQTQTDFGVLGLQNAESIGFQQIGREFKVQQIVLDNKYGFAGHYLSPACRDAAG